jgi:hypothetical protein
VPVNARLNLGIGSSAGVYVAAGPRFGFNIGDDEYSWKSLDESKANAENTFQLKKSNFSVNLGAGFYVSKHLEFGFTYNSYYLSTLIANDIPKEIARVALRNRLLCETPKEELKICKDCGKALPRHPLFYTKNSGRKDGF